MRRLLVGTTLASACLLTLAASVPARALVAMPDPGPMKAMKADVVVTGQVLQLLDQDVKASATKGSKQTLNYRIAVMRVNETIKGKIKGNIVKVGFPVYNNTNPKIRPPVGNPRIRPLPIPRPGRRGMQLTAGMDGLFFLNKHHEGNFFVLPQFYGYISSQNKQNFETEVAQTKLAIKIAANPKVALESLKSKDPQKRLQVASFMVYKYRYRGIPYSGKTKPVGAVESKLILKTLLENSWDFNQYRTNYRLNPRNLFGQLGVNQKDGFNRPKSVRGQNYNLIYEKAAKEWIRSNLNTYRIQQFVPGKPGQPGVRPLPGVRPVPGIRLPFQIQPVPGKPGRPIQIQPGKIKIQIQGGVQIQGRPVQIRINQAQQNQQPPRVDRKDD